MAAPASPELDKALKVFNDHLLRGDRLLDGITKHIGRISDHGTQLAAKWGFKQTAAFFDKVVSGLHESEASLRLIVAKLGHQRMTLLDDISKAEQSGNIAAKKDAEQRLESLLREYTHYQRTLSIKTAINKADKVAFGTLELIFKLAVSTRKSYSEINEAIRAADSSSANRLKLTQSIFNVQRLTGSSLESAKDAAAALVNRGLELHGGFEANLKTVVQLKDGLGLAADQAAELAALTDRQHVDFGKVADSLATIVKETGLAADQAGRMAGSLLKAASVFESTVTSQLPKVIEFVGRLEGLLREMGAEGDSFTKLLTKLTTIEGIGAAGILGIRNPEFLKSEQATKQVVDNFASYAKNMLGDAAGWERVMRLEAIGSQFELTSQEVNNMIKAFDENAKRIAGQTTLQKLFDEQMAASGKGISQLKESLGALMKEGMAPVIMVFNVFVSLLNKLVHGLQQIRGLATVIGGVLVGATILLTMRIWSLARSLTAAAIAGSGFEKSLTARGGIAGLGRELLGLKGGQGGPGMFAALRAPMSMALGPVTAALGALVAGAAVGYSLQKKLWEITEEQNRRSAGHLTVKGEQGLEGALLRRVQSGTLTKSELLNIGNQARDYYMRTEKLTAAAADNRVRKLMQSGATGASEQKFLLQTGRSITGYTDKEKQQLATTERTIALLRESLDQWTNAATKGLADEKAARKDKQETEALINNLQILNRGSFKETTPYRGNDPRIFVLPNK